MPKSRLNDLILKLERGHTKTQDRLATLTTDQWALPVYLEPAWNVRNLIVHFLSAETQLLALAKNVAGGGTGAPPRFDIDHFNAEEQIRYQGQSATELLVALGHIRQQTIQWVHSLDDTQLDKVGRHPALGEISVEEMVKAIFGHQLLHLRDLNRIERNTTCE